MNKIVVILIILILFVVAIASFAGGGDELTGEDIYVKNIKTKITDYSDDSHERYAYSIDYELYNVSTSFAGSKVITYLYNNDKLVTNNDTYNNNTTIIEDGVLLKEFNHVYVYSDLWSYEKLNVTHFKIVVVNDDGEVIFNTTKPFDMNNYVKDSDLDWDEEIEEEDDEKSYSSKNSDYEFFENTDLNGDGKIDFTEFSDVSYIFTEDSFWDGYSIEEILQSEWDRADSDGDDYLTFEEFKSVI